MPRRAWRATRGPTRGRRCGSSCRASTPRSTGLGDVFRAVVAAEAPPAAGQYAPFIDVLDRDAHAAQAAVRLVLAQPGISSQLVDNLNASIHLRALLTDIFLVDETLKGQGCGLGARGSGSTTAPFAPRRRRAGRFSRPFALGQRQLCS